MHGNLPQEILGLPYVSLRTLFCGLRLPYDAFGHRPASPLGRSLWEAWRPPSGNSWGTLHLLEDASGHHPTSPLGCSLSATKCAGLSHLLGIE
ncbi:unnamed protein product [Prunus armeniaca]